MTCGIYCIENKINGKKYIGQGLNVILRMSNNHKDTPAIYNALKRYGKNNFKRYIILYCETSELDYYEIKCIKIFHSHKSEWGYNISWGGGAFFTGGHHTDEAKKKISIAMSGENHPLYGTHHSVETKKLMRDNHADFKGENHPQYGTHPSEETRKKQSESHKNPSNEVRKNMSESHKNPSLEIRMAISRALTGRKRTDETKKKISLATSGKNNSMFGKIGRDSPNFGKKHKKASSQYYGVSRTIRDKKYVYWVCRVGGKYVGIYEIEIIAARAYDKYVIKNNIDRPLNFPENYKK